MNLNYDKNTLFNCKYPTAIKQSCLFLANKMVKIRFKVVNNKVAKRYPLGLL